MLLLLPGFLLLWGTGCGFYTFNPGGKSDIKSIAIERFDNKTSEYELADRMTDIVIDAFISDGSMKVVSSENADAVLVGILTQYDRKPFKYDENDQVESYSVTMTFDITLRKPRETSDIWHEIMAQEGIYDIESETGEVDAQQTIIDRLIEAIINRTTKSW